MDRGGELRIATHYDTRKFDSAAIERLVDQLLEVLRTGVTQPALSVRQLCKLPNGERRQVLEVWNDTQEVLGDLRCVHGAFEENAARTPDAVAVVCKREQLTYRELNERANQLAHYLQSLGVGREDFVSMYLDRSLEVAVAALAIWKAGAVFVPLDPDYPRQRIALILEDCQPRVLLSNRRLIDDLDYSGPAIVLERDGAAIQGHSRKNPRHDVTLENAAYVIYTSGSTGKPKGTINHHRALSNLMTSDVAANAFTRDDRYLSRCALGFDVFVQELLRPFMTGGTLVLAGNEEYRDPAALVQLIQTQRVSVVIAVPAMWKAILDEPGSERCESIRYVFCGGDLLTPEVMQLHKAKLKAELFNIYGPAETAIWVTVFSCDGDRARNRIPIGRPIPNCRIYVLDDQWNPVPIGVEGELYVAGVAVGRGYLNRPELTAERFLPDPFMDSADASMSGSATPGSTMPGATMYRTGDRARWLPDGNIEFLGRRDNQIKIRGVRIEIGEIESVLRQHPLVNDAAVDVRELPDGEKGIAAYLVDHPEESNALDDPRAVEDLREYIQQRVPSAMQPASYTVVDHLPLSPNGKIDRRQLPEPQWARPLEKSNHSSTRTPIESRLATIWQEVLNVDHIGVHDNFFELGGHSFLAVKAMTRIRSEFRVSLPLAKIFTAPTLAKLSCEIENSTRAEPSGSDVVAVAKIDAPSIEGTDGPLVHVGAGQGPPLFVVHGMGGYAANLVPLGRELHDCCDVFTLEAQGPFDDRVPHDNFTEMAEYYVKAVRQQQPRGPYLLAGWSMGGTVAWEMARQLREAGEVVGRLLLIDSYPLWGTNLAQRSEFVAARLLTNLGPSFADIQSLPKSARWRAIVERAEVLSGPGASAIRQLVRTCEAHQKACGTYVPDELDVDVTAFWAQEQWRRRLVSQWRKRARSYTSQTVQGDHYSMLEPPNVEQLAAEVRRHVQLTPLASRKAG